MSKRRRNPGDEGLSALRRRYALEPTRQHFVQLHGALRRADPEAAAELVRERVRPVLGDGALYVQLMTELEELGLAGDLVNEALLGHGPIYRYGHRWSDPIATPEHRDVSWGDLESLPRWDATPRPWHLVLPEGMSGGDYSGMAWHNRVNHDVFMREHGDKPGVFSVYGGHGSYGVAIRLDTFDDEIVAQLNALADYPILDEQALSEAETEAQDEAWENWVRGDFVRELEHVIPGLSLDDVDPEVLWTTFLEQADRSNTYWETESDGPTIDVRRIAHYVAEHDQDAVTELPGAVYEGEEDE